MKKIWIVAPSALLAVGVVTTLGIYIPLVLRTPETYWNIGDVNDFQRVGDYPLQEIDYAENKNLTINFFLAYYDDKEYQGQKTNPNVNMWKTSWTTSCEFTSKKYESKIVSPDTENNLKSLQEDLTDGLTITAPTVTKTLTVDFYNKKNDLDELTSSYLLQLSLEITSNENFGIKFNPIMAPFIFYLSDGYKIIVNLIHQIYEA